MALIALTVLNCSDKGGEPAVPCHCPHQADYDLDGKLTRADLDSLTQILFNNGVESRDEDCPVSRGDYDADGFVTSFDMNYLIDYINGQGGLPCDPCLDTAIVCANVGE